MGRSSSADAARLPVALSCGEPSGIGPELVVKAWLAAREGRLRPFVVFADPAILAARASLIGLDLDIEETDPAAPALSGAALAVCPLENRFIDRPGTPVAGNAAGVIEAIERAVGAVASGHAAALVTPPIAKKPLYEAGFAFPGHTEFLGHLAGKVFGRPARPVMMLSGAGLRTVPLTIHVALAEVPPLVTTELIVETATIVAGDLARRFAVPRPRLAVSGLNPHAGEDGAMGREEIDVIAPAIARLRAAGLDVKGPLPADTMFHARARREYDAAICMYHDQALIPLKTLAFDEGVNVTLGLPFIRTSPDHGTAFDIAGKGIARPDSLIAAIAMAEQMAAAEAGGRP